MPLKCPHCDSVLDAATSQPGTPCPHCGERLSLEDIAAGTDLEPDDDGVRTVAGSWSETGDSPETCEGPGGTLRETDADDGMKTRPGTVMPSDPSPSASHTRVETVWGTCIPEDMDPARTYKPTMAGGSSMAGDDRETRGKSGTKDDDEPDHPPAGYDLIEVLGEGNMGMVYKARQQSVDRQIAVKMMKARLLHQSQHKDKFISEAVATADLDHPNIVPIHDLGTNDQGRPFYVMKLVRGTPWNDVIGVKSRSENLDILLDVTDAIAFAHAKGILHRDLKPENVMLGEYGEVQLMDWGVAVSITPAGKATLISQATAKGGTPRYMSPEMVLGEVEKIGVRSDVYLLGAILYEIITGRPPHEGKLVLECLERAANNEIRTPDEAGELVDIAFKAMSTEPEDRYESALAFKQAIRDYQSHEQSIQLCGTAGASLDQALTSGNYDDFSESLYGYRQSLKLWPEYDTARHGLCNAQLQYARCAFDNGDLDLAASLLDRVIPDHDMLADQIEHAREKRRQHQRKLRLFKKVAIVSMLGAIMVLSVAYVWVSKAREAAVAAEAKVRIEKQKVEQEREKAVTAKEEEARQRQIAEVARVKAQEEESKAIQALEEMERAVKEMLEAQRKEQVAKEEADEARDELARSGMLLDNAWWTFDADTAKTKQRQAAEEAGKTVTMTMTLDGEADAIDFVFIPPGSFVMGSSAEEQFRTAEEYLHRVNLTDWYYMSRYELTESQWVAITGEPPPVSEAHDVEAGLPVTEVSWQEIHDKLLPAIEQYVPEGYTCLLPSEAQWEYACRAGTGSSYYTGEYIESLDQAGWYVFNSERTIKPVGQKEPNAWGLYDMHGNVSEWCLDYYDARFYLDAGQDDPVCTIMSEVEEEQEQMVVRGGGCLNLPRHCRSAYRSYAHIENRYKVLGLRLILVSRQNQQPTVTEVNVP